jgi:hypothetical protein
MEILLNIILSDIKSGKLYFFLTGMIKRILGLDP